MLTKVADEVVGEHAAGAAASWKEITRTFLVEDAMVTPMVSMVANDNWIELVEAPVFDVRMRTGAPPKAE